MYLERNIAEDWCKSRNHTSSQSLFSIQKVGWGTDDKNTKGGSAISQFNSWIGANFLCHDPKTGDSIATIHLYSSRDSSTVSSVII